MGAIKRHSCHQIGTNENYISIPYGAIKRYLYFSVYITPDYISIPYGAIKRQAKLEIDGRIMEFQFLMVRLKDSELRK